MEGDDDFEANRSDHRRPSSGMVDHGRGEHRKTHFDGGDLRKGESIQDRLELAEGRSSDGEVEAVIEDVDALDGCGGARTGACHDAAHRALIGERVLPHGTGTHIRVYQWHYQD